MTSNFLPSYYGFQFLRVGLDLSGSIQGHRDGEAPWDFTYIADYQSQPWELMVPVILQEEWLKSKSTAKIWSRWNLVSKKTSLKEEGLMSHLLWLRVESGLLDSLWEPMPQTQPWFGSRWPLDDLSGLLITHWKRGLKHAWAGEQPSSIPDSLHPKSDSAHYFKKFFPISSLLLRTTSGFFGFFNIFEILLIFKSSKCLRLRKKISFFF